MATGSVPQPDRRVDNSRDELFSMVEKIDKRTEQTSNDVGEIKVSLFGPEGQPAMGFVTQTTGRLKDHDDRIGEIEKNYWKWAGAITALAALVTLAVNILVKH